MTDSTMPHPFEFKWGAIPISYDRYRRTVTLSIDNVDEGLKAWLDQIFGTGEDEAALVRELEATVAAGGDTAPIEARLVSHFQSMGVAV
jgi:hypothetical protein